MQTTAVSVSVTVIIVDEEIKDETRSLPVPVAASQHLHSLTHYEMVVQHKGKGQKQVLFIWAPILVQNSPGSRPVFPSLPSCVCVLLPLSCAAAPRPPSLRRCCFVFKEQMGTRLLLVRGSRPAPVNTSACVVPDAWSFARSN